MAACQQRFIWAYTLTKLMYARLAPITLLLGQPVLWTGSVCPPQPPSSSVEVLTPTVTLPGDMAFMAVIQVPEAIRVGSALIG